jgi:hypothetical protein
MDDAASQAPGDGHTGLDRLVADIRRAEALLIEAGGDIGTMPRDPWLAE